MPLWLPKYKALQNGYRILSRFWHFASYSDETLRNGFASGSSPFAHHTLPGLGFFQLPECATACGFSLQTLARAVRSAQNTLLAKPWESCEFLLKCYFLGETGLTPPLYSPVTPTNHKTRYPLLWLFVFPDRLRIVHHHTHSAEVYRRHLTIRWYILNRHRKAQCKSPWNLYTLKRLFHYTQSLVLLGWENYPKDYQN